MQLGSYLRGAPMQVNFIMLNASSRMVEFKLAHGTWWWLDFYVFCYRFVVASHYVADDDGLRDNGDEFMVVMDCCIVLLRLTRFREL